MMSCINLAETCVGKAGFNLYRYYSLTDSIDTASAKSILATNIYGNELFLPIDVESERGYTFSVTASTRYRMESEPSPDTYYYLSKFIK